ncbi:hypothetical protein PHYSODRAFT_299449 [Phytophthora sojae]|uniref:RxLR effector protein n=1 Tax=Phytophthora sojae (strain P6497) TaxID=1094619 RepID=G4Z8F9_PHYSP|nr:hypothetical protein PHYSODRAFT_299449 [Phytophthora sojae]EGZ21879.1 hypothetical protein PHYSODRAFT_299449 [Phytophthora sojae]|eukprot:XP_009524596.1 hypothetical protein PHYSODRAFT_299449 [Phytophthora sojae]
MRYLQVILMAVATILTIRSAYSVAVDNKQSTVAAEAANWPRSDHVDGTAGKLRTDSTADKNDDSKRRLSPESTAANDEERTSLARLAAAKAQIRYWSWIEANPNVVYRGFGLHKLNGEALEKSKLRALWKAYALKWKGRQATISIR